MAEKMIRVYSYHRDKTEIPSKWKFDLPHHPCVAPEPTVQNRYYALCKGREMTLRDYISKTHDVIGFEKPLLIQMAYAINHIHHHGKVVRRVGEETNNALKEDNFKFSEDGKTVVLTRFSPVDPTKVLTEKENIAALGVLFYCILSDNETCAATVVPGVLVHSYDSVVAAELINSMRCSFQSSEDVLKHPYFWSTSTKIDFLCSLCQLLKKYSRLKNKFNESQISPKLFERSGWIEQLKEGTKECGDDLQDAVYKLATDPKLKELKIPIIYNKLEPFSLLCFVRNCKAHYWDYTVNNSNARRALGNDCEGLWGFFNTKFPNLFMVVYEFVNGNKKIKPNFQSEYFDELAKTYDLVQCSPVKPEKVEHGRKK